MIPQSLPGTYSGGESSRGFGSRLRSACVSRLSAVDPIVLVMWSAVLGAMLAGFVLTGVPVDLAVDGCVEHRQTHQLTVDGLLRETGLALGANDLVSPPPTTRLRRNMRVDVSSARRIVVHVDGGTIEMHTQATLLGDVLTEAGVVLQPHDQIFVAERPISADQLLPAFEATETPATDVCPLRWSSLPVNVAVKRALHVEMYDGNDVTEFFTAQPTVGLALYEQGVPVYVADLVTPSLSETIQEDAKIRIERSFPVTISADGRTRHTRTREKMVGHVLAQAGILLQGKDYVTPGLEEDVEPNESIQVVRVKEDLRIDQQVTPFETSYVPADNMPLDSNRIVSPGQAGITKISYHVVYQNGKVITETLEDDWAAQHPEDKVVAYGTAVQVATLETPDGPIEYWRHFRALATSYSAATSGKSRDDPHYGFTRSGLPAGKGIISVDPKVIPLGSNVYIPDYGRAIAGDTGGSVIGRRVDLGFDEDVPPHWYRWVDVYMLTPVPPADSIRYVLPNWPQE